MSKQRTHGGLIRWVAVAVLSAPLLTGCSEASARSQLNSARRNEEALVEAVLEALSRQDEVALQGFLISREEYETLLWPEMPDKKYTPFDFVWGLNAANTRKGLAQLVSHYGGAEFELVSLDFTEEPEVYESFRLHPGVAVEVRRLDTGEVGLLPSFDVFIEYGGEWKLLNYDEI